MTRPASETDGHAPSATPRTEGILGFLLVCLAWLLVRPYQGVRHDGILYLGQALHLLRPDIFGHDLFFSHGSQDKFTLVSGPLAWLLSRFSVATVEIALTAVCNLAFVAATWTLAGTLVPGRRWLATAGVVVLSHAYGVLADFNYGENFFTARSVAEPLVLLALTACLRRRVAVGALLFTAAALVHPLMTLPALVVAWMYGVVRDRRWLWGLAVLVPVIAAAVTEIGPFAGLLARFDDVWWNAIGELDSQVRMMRWNSTDLVSLALDLVLLGVATTALPPVGRRFAQALLAASVLLLALAFAGGDLARNVLLVQLQLWRVLWLVHAVAMLCLPIRVVDRWSVGGMGRLVGVAAAAAELSVSWTLPFAWTFVAWLVLAALAERRAGDTSRRVAAIAVACTLLAVAVTTGILVVGIWRDVARDVVLASVTNPAIVMLAIPTLGGASLVATAWLLCRLPRWGALALVAALLVSSLPQWDQRSQWIRFVETTPFGQHPFDKLIPESAQVYWHMELLLTWTALGRASWVSPNQGSGIVFNRSTAIDFTRRSAQMYAMFADQARCQMAIDAAGGTQECQPSQASVEALCRQPDAPDFMVFDAAYPRGQIARWDYQVARGGPLRTAYLYDCAGIR